MKRFARGSEWRKWDLHVHPPGTTLSNAYQDIDGVPALDVFCKIVHESDVQAIGITDYFSLDGFFTFKERYDQLYPSTTKVFFPNLEIRLNESVNRGTEPVDFHLIFPPGLTREEADRFLQELKTQITIEDDKQKSCAELSGATDFQSATVSRSDIKKAINSHYGDNPNRQDKLLLIAAASAIRADAGSQRKRALADSIDKMANGYFGNPRNVGYFLDPSRLDGELPIIPKPVFSGCDAHSFADLESCLGKQVSHPNEKHITWIKADLTFEGLQQTLSEPEERVRIQATAPDQKEPYKVISRIKFANSADFPEEVVFNPGLNAIIGSRSSGKSALLAYIAHAVDPVYTVDQQVAAGFERDEAGPGAAHSWESVSDLDYGVEWCAAEASEGRVIYIPQNSLFSISERPADITEKIQPAVFRQDPDFESEFHQAMSVLSDCNRVISTEVRNWFGLAEEMRALAIEIRGLGDSEAIKSRHKKLKAEIEVLQEASSLTAEEVEQYQGVMADITLIKAQLAGIVVEQRTLGPYVEPGSDEGTYIPTAEVALSIEATPDPESMPEALGQTLKSILEEGTSQIIASIGSVIVDYRSALDVSYLSKEQEIKDIEKENGELIDKNVANVQIASLVNDSQQQASTLAEIEKRSALSQAKAVCQDQALASTKEALEKRANTLDVLITGFNESNHQLDGLSFRIESGYEKEVVSEISQKLNRRERSPYLKSHGGIDLAKVLAEPEKFVAYVGAGNQGLRQGQDACMVTIAVLSLTEEIRFVASLEGDHIGGFRKSSMTPGKQAMFALTLILAESEEPWPLLIDQPEDDLDSRSLCDVVVKDLLSRKRERQIIMVTHNANLVLGADSEEVIVANRHGDDRPNRDNKTFAYLSGSLEYSKPKDDKEQFTLESAGIREHACDILDGGEVAFQKRKEKYRI